MRENVNVRPRKQMQNAVMSFAFRKQLIKNTFLSLSCEDDKPQDCVNSVGSDLWFELWNKLSVKCVTLLQQNTSTKTPNKNISPADRADAH